MQTFIRIHPEDTVAVALQPLAAGTAVVAEGKPITLREDIPQGHKFALVHIPAGEAVIKYGSPIGTAVTDILPGSWIHTSNLKTGLGDVLTYTYSPSLFAGTDQAADALSETPPYFYGYRRKNGRAGVRNEIWIIPTVGCVNNVAETIADRAQGFLCGSLDAIAAFPHPYGCSQMGEDQENTRQILPDLVNHPNAGGILVLGLGCENSNIEELKKYIGTYDPDRV